MSIMGGAVRAIIGRAGEIVFLTTPYGGVIKPIQEGREIAEEVKQRNRIIRATALETYHTLTPPQNQAWKLYSTSVLNTDPDTGKMRAQTAYGAFMSLTPRFLALHPDGDIPLMPPMFPFAGDAMILTITTDTEGITFTAPQPSRPQTYTELLICSLFVREQTARIQDLQPAGYYRFTAAMPSIFFEAPAGWYAVASRYVHSETGQVTQVLRYPHVEVLGEKPGRWGILS